MVTFQLEQSQENLTSHSGLALFGATLEGSQLANKLNQIELPKAKQEPLSRQLAEGLFAHRLHFFR